jgi:hypothetical protein
MNSALKTQLTQLKNEIKLDKRALTDARRSHNTEDIQLWQNELINDKNKYYMIKELISAERTTSSDPSATTSSMLNLVA